MVKIVDGKKKVCCDRCSIELNEKVIVISSGDCLCDECFEKEHKVMTAEEYLTPEE